MNFSIGLMEHKVVSLLLIMALFECIFSRGTVLGLSPGTSNNKKNHLLKTWNKLKGLDIAVIGGGPSGLLCTHRLLLAGCCKVTLYEGRGDPRCAENIKDDRAYALGVGIRGRTAIKTVDDDLWQAVRSRGFPCDKFLLHPTPRISLTLRDGKTSAAIPGTEPSILLYQSDLCSVLLDELENRYASSNRLKLNFNSKVETVNMISSKERKDTASSSEQYDLVIGCDGVRSKVRDSMMSYSPDIIKTLIREIPGIAKVSNVPMPSSDKLDPESVHLIIPKGAAAGAVTAFVEPTIKGACILFAGRVNDDEKNNGLQLLSPFISDDRNVTELGIAVRESFPLLADQLTDKVIEGIARQHGFSSSAVKSNIYHCGLLAICGDAAHATGGVSGQGCNSALVDASVLVDCLEHELDANMDNKMKTAAIKSALLKYSQLQVPEGTALFELAIGPDEGVSIGRRILSSISALTDFIFKSGNTIQRTLGTTLTPFSVIRRQRGIFFDEQFLNDEEYNIKLMEMHNRMMKDICKSGDKVVVSCKNT